MLPLILASSSRYRRQLLDKLQLPYAWHSPDIDETPHADELPEQLVARLARQKALALGERFPANLIIGSDQVATLEKRILGKPGSHRKAVEQLMLMQGKTVDFITGLALLNSRSGNLQCITDVYRVTFRPLTIEEIDNYLLREQPYDCAGSFKCEGLGIGLFSSMNGSDPNSLVGLPLIQLVNLLQQEGAYLFRNDSDQAPRHSKS
jgi:septum formation protein